MRNCSFLFAFAAILLSDSVRAHMPNGGNVEIGTTATAATFEPAVRAEGNAALARDKGGFVKAMAFIDPSSGFPIRAS